MKIIKSISDIEKLAGMEKDCVLTIGNFDGVHIGHKQIITRAKRIADERKTVLIMLTFEPHPLAVLHPKHAPGVLTPIPMKKHLLEKLGVDWRLALKSSREFLSLTAEDFLNRFLVENTRPAVVVEGDDFNFGADRGGSIETLKKMASQKTFEVVVVDSQNITLGTGQTVRVSSTLIRYMLSNGHVADASLALGRFYRLIGKIIPGRGIGKKLGFPTLNMMQPKQVIPDEGVYAGLVNLGDSEYKVCVDNQRISAVFSIGQAETYGRDNPLAIEAHLLTGTDAGLTGQWMALDFVKQIRKQEKFESEKDLARQIEKDCLKAKQILDDMEFGHE